jgi:hypothetical protein
VGVVDRILRSALLVSVGAIAGQSIRPHFVIPWYGGFVVIGIMAVGLIGISLWDVRKK